MTPLPSHPRLLRRRARRGFTLLEVMMATAILVVALAILVEAQGTAAYMTVEADRILTATQLAQEKLVEVRMMVENEGFPDDDVFEEGDFDDFGDDAMNAEFSDLDEYHWEYLVAKVDLEMATDLSGMAANMMGSAGGGAAVPTPESLGIPGLNSEVIATALDPYIREVRVHVFWGTDDPDVAEERGDDVLIVTHVIQPNMNLSGVVPGGGGGGGGGDGSGGDGSGGDGSSGGGNNGNNGNNGSSGSGSTRSPRGVR